MFVLIGTSFFSLVTSSIDTSAFESLAPKEKKRQQHIRELISTEESYVEDMSIVLDVSLIKNSLEK